jgi:hypothetical protein
VEPYVPIPAADVGDYDSTLDALSAVDDEINNNADFWAWDLTKPLTYGCQFGGTISYRVSDEGYDVTLDGCAFSRGLDLTGDATINDVKGTFSLSADAATSANLTYERDSAGERSATGDLP